MAPSRPGGRRSAGVVGSAPPVNTPTESVPSPALSTRSNLTATLFSTPAYPSPPPAAPTAVGPAFWRANVSPSPCHQDGASPTRNRNDVVNPRMSTGPGPYTLPAWNGESASRSRSPTSWADPFRARPAQARGSDHRRRVHRGGRSAFGVRPRLDGLAGEQFPGPGREPGIPGRRPDGGRDVHDELVSPGALRRGGVGQGQGQGRVARRRPGRPGSGARRAGGSASRPDSRPGWSARPRR